MFHHITLWIHVDMQIISDLRYTGSEEEMWGKCSCDIVTSDWVNGAIMRAGPYSVSVIIVTMQTWIIMPQCRPLGDQEAWAHPSSSHHKDNLQWVRGELRTTTLQEPGRPPGKAWKRLLRLLWLVALMWGWKANGNKKKRLRRLCALEIGKSLQTSAVFINWWKVGIFYRCPCHH